MDAKTCLLILGCKIFKQTENNFNITFVTPGHVFISVPLDLHQQQRESVHSSVLAGSRGPQGRRHLPRSQRQAP